MGRCQAGAWHGCVCSLGRLQPCLGLSCWGCVPTPAAPLSPFRAEEPEGPSALISLWGFLGSHPKQVFFFPPVTGGAWGELPFPVGVRASRSLLGAALWQATQPRYFWSIPVPGIVPSATQPCVWSPVLWSWELPGPGVSLCLCDIWTRCSSIDMVTYKVCLISINSNDNLDKSEFPLLFVYPGVCPEN